MFQRQPPPSPEKVHFAS